MSVLAVFSPYFLSFSTFQKVVMGNLRVLIKIVRFIQLKTGLFEFDSLKNICISTYL